jgi:hypothetical protein
MRDAVDLHGGPGYTPGFGVLDRRKGDLRDGQQRPKTGDYG